MTDVRDVITELRGKGWTVAAIADEVGVDYRSVIRWQTGEHYPANSAGVMIILRRLLTRRRIPKRKRYRRQRNPPATE